MGGGLIFNRIPHGRGAGGGVLNHVDLFSGIGGFAIAAQANGVETVCFCEKDERCRAFLMKAWPGINIHDDIKTFDGRQYAGAYLLTAGVPCQPASRAGKQRGKEDDRWLWPDAVRVLAEVRPAWAIFENPPGIGDVGIAGILSDVEGQGYAVRVFSIPACAVSAPQRRERFWIVCRKLADTGQPGCERLTRADKSYSERREKQDGSSSALSQGDMADAVCIINGKHQAEQEGWSETQGHYTDSMASQWRDFVWLPCADGKVRRAPDDSVGLVDGLHRSVLGALGNSIVPQVAAEIIGAIVKSETEF